LRTALTLREMEAIHISDALRRHHGNRAAAARELGINPSTLFRKLARLGIDGAEDTPTRSGHARSRVKKRPLHADEPRTSDRSAPQAGGHGADKTRATGSRQAAGRGKRRRK